MHKVSVLTPTWNRAENLKELYSSLLCQSFKDFEWIIADDCSSDDTYLIIKVFLAEAPFPITYIRYSKRVGKVRADNTLLNLKNAQLVVWCDSDDILAPDAIRKLVQEWDSIDSKSSSDFIGIVALCSDRNGKIQSTGKFKFKPFVARWKDLSEKYNMTGDMCIMQNSSLIGAARFPEHDLVMSESGFWHQFMQLNVLCIPDVLKIMRRDTPNRISGSSRMEYCRGKAYSIIYADSENFHKKTLKNQLILASKYHRYSIHGDISFNERSAMFRGQKNVFYYLGAMCGSIQAIKDRAQRRVVKTHRIFELGRDASYTIYRNFA